MIIKSEVCTLLEQRLGGQLSGDEISALAAEIEELQTGWEEVHFDSQEMGYTLSVECLDICALAEAVGQGKEIRFFKRRVSS